MIKYSVGQPYLLTNKRNTYLNNYTHINIAYLHYRNIPGTTGNVDNCSLQIIVYELN